MWEGEGGGEIEREREREKRRDTRYERAMDTKRKRQAFICPR